MRFGHRQRIREQLGKRQTWEKNPRRTESEMTFFSRFEMRVHCHSGIRFKGQKRIHVATVPLCEIARALKTIVSLIRNKSE